MKPFETKAYTAPYRTVPYRTIPYHNTMHGTVWCIATKTNEKDGLVIYLERSVQQYKDLFCIARAVHLLQFPLRVRIAVWIYDTM